MYFPVGWPKILNTKHHNVPTKSVFCNRDRSLFGVLTEDSVDLWYYKPCIEIISYQRSKESVEKLGKNSIAEWNIDSSMIVVATTNKNLIFLKVEPSSKNSHLYAQYDSKVSSLKRESAELFTKDTIPNLSLSVAFVAELSGSISSLSCIRDELMVCTLDGSIKRIGWDGTINTDYCLRLPRLPFAIDQQLSKAMPLDDEQVYISNLDYSPLLTGFSLVFSDGRAAFLTGPSLLFEPNQVQGIWAQNLKNATCTAINHKYRLIAFGLQNAQGIVYSIDEVTGALQVSHRLVLSSKDFPDAEKAAGGVKCMAWSPDGSTLVLAWNKGGISLWSVFGSLLMCTLNWMSATDGVHWKFNVCSVEWAVEGYSLWMVSGRDDQCDNGGCTQNVVQLQFVKSALTVNPCMSAQSVVFLQGEDRLYVNAGDAVIHRADDPYQRNDLINSTHANRGNLLGNKQWLVVQVPHSYIKENWPIRYACIDDEGEHIAVAGLTGLAHFCVSLKRWKLFGNESQERDFVVTGGMLWWKDHIIVGCYNLHEHRDEVRLYTRHHKLDNSFVKVIKVVNQVLLVCRHDDHLAVFTADSQITIYNLHSSLTSVDIQRSQVIDVSALTVHPACVVAITLTPLRAETVRSANKQKDLSILINVCGKLVMVQKDRSRMNGSTQEHPTYTSPVVLASCVENVWVSPKIIANKLHLTEALWIACGAHGMRVWLPLLPRDGEKPHNFMSKRIMLPISNTICPLAVLFEDAVILGAENDFVLYSDDVSPSLPYSVVNRTSQVYLHHIFRQLLKRNLGLHAWEIARSCNSLPYFPHSLELLLHEVLEEEATSSEPIPDALLPRVVDFIREFPVFLQTVVQCARKIEIALWHYLFSTVGNPKTLFLECLDKRKLETAASYLIILQNLESSNSSRHHATLLLDSALELHKWELAKDIVRFLRAIDPQDLESSPRTPNVTPLSTTSKYPAVSPYTAHSASSVNANEEDLSSMFGLMQVIQRNRSQSSASSTSNAVKLSQSPDNVSTVNSINKQIHNNVTRTGSDSRIVPRRRTSSGRDFNDDYFLDAILNRHAKKLLSVGRIYDLCHFAAHLDFHLVSFLKHERRHGCVQISDYIMTLKKLHSEFQWPYPVPQHPLSIYAQKITPVSSRKSSNSTLMTEQGNDKTSHLHIDIASAGLKSTESNIGDSGYISNSANDDFFHTKTPNLADSDFISQNLDAFLSPHTKPDESSLAMEMSDECSLWSDDPGLDNVDTTSSWSAMGFNQEFGYASQELTSKGPSQSEVQLRYLLQLVLEAECLEWSLIIAIVLRDLMAVVRTINSSRQPDCSDDSAAKLRDCLLVLSRWVDTECLGYKPFFFALQNQVQILDKHLKSSPRVLKLQSQSSTSSCGEIPSTAATSNSPNETIATKLKNENDLAAEDEDLANQNSDNLNQAIMKNDDVDDAVFAEHSVSDSANIPMPAADGCVVS